MDPDLALLERWRGGDAQAGEDLFARHFEEVYRFFDPDLHAEAEALVQQTFEACLRGAVAARSTFRTYLFAAARDELYRHGRRLDLDEPVDFATASVAPAIAAGPTESAAGGERVRAALRRLPVAQRVLLTLHAWHDMDAAALAEVLDLPAGEVPAKLERAREALRALLG